MRSKIAPGASQAVFGAFDGVTLVAVAALRRQARAKLCHRALVQGVFTLPAYRGQGIARLLMRAMQERARTWPGLLWLSLAVHAGNEAASSLYRSCGFCRVGRVPDAVRVGDDFVDEELMECRIDSAAVDARAPADACGGGYQLLEAVPDAATYRHLREAAGLSPKTEEAARRGLAGTLFAVLVREGGETIGMGRVIGDGGSFYQVVDIAVLPGHQGKGLGKRIMAAIRGYIEREAPPSAYISLIADGDAQHLYSQYGFVHTAPKSVGMAMLKH
ncbi:GNAT family N-acetyltransferase [Chromobacterium sphagni]|uniref:GNAT family N-acetyltransferase n=1 Tax=Chromobacterium sphagni TaxID=1903179 RepID=UPI0023D87E45|nr:GNAT family N-acetyltransferase [Chromobacterium sphagni]